jgi:hypothetical protein
MGVNRYKEHMVVLLEDEPYRDIMNGVQMLENVNHKVWDIKNPCGGSSKVFKQFEENIKLLDKYHKCHILLIIDFDDKTTDGVDFFKIKIEKFKEIVPYKYTNRVFLLGVNHKESEDLKRFFRKSNFEAIGKLLVENCPSVNSNWNNIHLECNMPEINRMKELKIYNWLFA